MRSTFSFFAFLFSLYSLTAQIYIKEPEQTSYTRLNENKKGADKNLSNLSKSFFKAYHNRIKKVPVYIADSLHFVITTDFEGRFGALLYSDTRSAGNLQGFLDALKKARFSQPGTYAFSVVFPKLKDKAVPIWLLQDPPEIEICTRQSTGQHSNIVFERSCFAYFVQKRIVDLEPPPVELRDNLSGYIGATITVNANGKAIMAEFDSLSYNPQANDYFAETLKKVRFPRGGYQNGMRMGYSFEVRDEYFGTAELLRNKIDSIPNISASALTYNAFDGTFTPITNVDIDTTFQSVKELFNFQVSNYKFVLTNDTTTPIMGSFLVTQIGGYEAASLTLVLTPNYFSETQKTNIAVPATFSSCTNEQNVDYASTCTADKFLRSFYNTLFNGNIPRVLPGMLSKQVVYVNKFGNVERIQVLTGSYNTNLDLEVMHALSTLPKLEPGKKNGETKPTIFTILGTM